MELAVTAVLLSIVLRHSAWACTPDCIRTARSARTIMAGSILGFSLPTFWVGLMLIMVFAVQLGWLPSTGRGTTAELFGVQWSFLTLDGLRHLLLPALNLSLFNISLVLRLTRAGVRETLPMDFVKFARAKGLSPARVIFVHVLKNIMIPVVTVVGLELGSTIAFAVVTESVFAWPGMGKLIIDSINVLDRPVIVAYLMMIVLLFVSINLVVDLLYTRARSARAAGGEGVSATALPAAAREETPFRRFVSEFAASRIALVGLVVFVLIALAAIFAARDRAAEPLRPRAARHHGRPPAARIAHRVPATPTSSAPTTRAATCSPASSTACASRLASVSARRSSPACSAPRSACSPPMSADAPMPPSCAWSTCSCRFPSILVALMILAMLGKGVMNVVLALVIVEWAYYARTVRASALVERRREYIEAAECLALPTQRIMFRHLLPNCLPPLIVIGTQQVARAIALEATLSFLGLGVPITEPSLGLLIANGYQYMLSGKYWISFYPGIALLVTIVAINLVGDQLRDVLNPRLQR